MAFTPALAEMTNSSMDWSDELKPASLTESNDRNVD